MRHTVRKWIDRLTHFIFVFAKEKWDDLDTYFGGNTEGWDVDGNIPLDGWEA